MTRTRQSSPEQDTPERTNCPFRPMTAGRRASRCSTGCARRERGVALMSQMPVACDDLLVRPTVVIVDDHAGFRSSARALLEAEGFDVVGEAGDGLSALAVIERLRPQVVLLDVQLPDIDGFEIAERLARASEPAVVVL